MELCTKAHQRRYYAWCARPESAHARRDRRLKVLVQASFTESKQGVGALIQRGGRAVAGMLTIATAGGS